MVGAIAMAPVSYEVRDGTPDCTTCGYFVHTLVGLTVRGTSGAVPVILGTLAGAVLGFAVIVIMRPFVRNPAS